MIIKKIGLTLLFVQNMIAMNQEQNKKVSTQNQSQQRQAFPQKASGLLSEAIYIEITTRSYYCELPEELPLLFDELREWCNDKKPISKKLPDQEITNILALFSNDVHNWAIKKGEVKRLKTNNNHIRSLENARIILAKIISLRDENHNTNRILIKAINNRINQLKQYIINLDKKN